MTLTRQAEDLRPSLTFGSNWAFGRLEPTSPSHVKWAIFHIGIAGNLYAKVEVLFRNRKLIHLAINVTTYRFLILLAGKCSKMLWHLLVLERLSACVKLLAVNLIGPRPYGCIQVTMLRLLPYHLEYILNIPEFIPKKPNARISI